MGARGLFGQKGVILIAGAKRRVEWPLEEVVLAGRSVGFFEDGAEGCVAAGGCRQKGGKTGFS